MCVEGESGLKFSTAYLNFRQIGRKSDLLGYFQRTFSSVLQCLLNIHENHEIEERLCFTIHILKYGFK